MTRFKPFKVSKGIYYFPSFEGARAYAQQHSFPTDRIRQYELGYAIQLRISGPYVGTDCEQTGCEIHRGGS